MSVWLVHSKEEGFGMRRSRLVAIAAVVGIGGFTGAALAGGKGHDF